MGVFYFATSGISKFEQWDSKLKFVLEQRKIVAEIHDLNILTKDEKILPVAPHGFCRDGIKLLLGSDF